MTRLIWFEYQSCITYGVTGAVGSLMLFILGGLYASGSTVLLEGTYDPPLERHKIASACYVSGAIYGLLFIYSVWQAKLHDKKEAELRYQNLSLAT